MSCKIVQFSFTVFSFFQREKLDYVTDKTLLLVLQTSTLKHCYQSTHLFDYAKNCSSNLFCLLCYKGRHENDNLSKMQFIYYVNMY